MKRIFQQSYRLVNWRTLSVLAGLALAGSAQATDPLFVNNSFLSFTVPGNPPPIYDVTAFDNENTFSIRYSLGATLYETLNTFYYTNNSLMTVSGNGFAFDVQTPNVIPRSMSGTFYNPGTVRCNSSQDGFGSGLGNCVVNASNVINAGSLIVGLNGQINVKSKYSDLSFGTLMVEPGVKLAASGAVGIGAAWDPTLNLGPNFAVSSTPNQVALFNSTPYMRVQGLGTTNVLVRAVFIANNSPKVPYNVYWQPANPALGPGFATIEWTGINQDPATCSFYTNYLYLNDFYELVFTTNSLVQANGIPNNFTFTQSGTPRMGGAAVEPPNFQNVFQPPSAINPKYAFVNAQMLSTTVATNASVANPSGALTNLPGKILITASNELNLANVQINGENYLSLTAPNQYDGPAPSMIVAPYSDINLGVTNGRLNVANLISSGVATLGGNLQAWSAEWVSVDGAGVNYDFRVMIVSSQLTPQLPSWIQSLRLHATNSLVINDVMNVYKSLYIDAQNLTLTTNTCGNGFTSFDGELNWYNSLTFGPTQIPNVLWLTNNGAIRSLQDSIFGTTGLRYSAFINNGYIADNGTIIWTTNFVNSGVITNGSGAFTMSARTAVMTNGAVYANSNVVSLTTTSLIISNEVLRAGRSLIIMATNLLTDGEPGNEQFCGGGLTNGNFWTVGTLANTGDGLSLPVKPALGDLLGTTITLFAPTNKSVVNLWSGLDRGYSVTGFSNNAAIGHLVLDAVGSSPLNGRFTFNGSDAISGNAIYVDRIEFKDYSTNSDANFDMQGITFNPNLVIYFAEAIRNGATFAEKLDKKNTNGAATHFRWIPSYAGNFSCTNLVYGGTTNKFNAALTESQQIDSDGDGILNYQDPTPFFISSQINLSLTVTNVPPRKARLTWTTPTGGTNTVYYKTNLLSPTWLVLTNFPSPQVYPAPPTAVTVLDLVGTNVTRFYRVSVLPWLTYPY